MAGVTHKHAKDAFLSEDTSATPRTVRTVPTPAVQITRTTTPPISPTIPPASRGGTSGGGTSGGGY